MCLSQKFRRPSHLRSTRARADRLRPDEMPDVEVLWEGEWCPGELRMQRQDKAGQWWCNVQYRRPGELSSHLPKYERPPHFACGGRSLLAGRSMGSSTDHRRRD